MVFLRYYLRNFVIAAGVMLMSSGTGFASEADGGTSLRSDARVELGKAVAAVAEATRKGALWIPAQRALVNAKAAFARGDHQEAISQARIAQRFTELGMDQLDSAPYQFLPR
jgi:hypothetical protein